MDYRERALEPLVRRLLEELPALLLVGPRATGKTTTALRYVSTSIRLDRPAEAEAFRADPDAALRGLEEPVLLDEWQVVPGVLGAVKRAVDELPRPGRYLLTGSVRAGLTAETWPGTGRLVRLELLGMTVRERMGLLPARPLVDRLARGEELSVPRDPPDLRGYVELALESGFPEPSLGLPADTRIRWLESYVEQLITRDVEQLGPGRDPARLRRYLESYALVSGGTVDDKTLFEAAGINRKTAEAYERLLTDLFVLHSLPAWTSNRLKRMVRTPKRFLVDPGHFAGILRIDASAIMRDGNLLGRALETFVVSELRSEQTISETRPRLFHLRTQQGRQEIDVVAELAGGDVVAVEVKADAAPRVEAARHIRWLRDQLGDRFLAGVVLHTGPRTYPLSPGIVAAPIATLWA